MITERIHTTGGDTTLSLLGPIHATRGSHRLDVAGDKERTVVVALGLAEGARTGVGTLIDAVWGEDPPRSAIRSLRTYIYRLRARGWESLIETTEEGYSLAVRQDSIDAVALEAALDAARSSADPDRRLALLDPVIRGVSVERVLCRVCDTPAMMLRRSMLRCVVTSAQELHAEALLRTRGALAVEPLRMLVRTDPTRECRWQMLIDALRLSGARSEASAIAHEARRFVGEYLGLPPESIGIEADGVPAVPWS